MLKSEQTDTERNRGYRNCCIGDDLLKFLNYTTTDTKLKYYSTQQEFQGKVLVDWFLNGNGDQFQVLNNSASSIPGPVESKSGLEIHEVGGAITSGPAKMVSVRLKPMEVHILAK